MSIEQQQQQQQQQQEAILTKKLSVLLGFEDGAADVLPHLLTIESSAVSVSLCVDACLCCVVSVQVRQLVSGRVCVCVDEE
jgi:hypothetical protein